MVVYQDQLVGANLSFPFIVFYHWQLGLLGIFKALKNDTFSPHIYGGLYYKFIVEFIINIMNGPYYEREKNEYYSSYLKIHQNDSRTKWIKYKETKPANSSMWFTGLV